MCSYILPVWLDMKENLDLDIPRSESNHAEARPAGSPYDAHGEAIQGDGVTRRICAREAS